MIYKSTKALTVPQEVTLHTTKRNGSKESKQMTKRSLVRKEDHGQFQSQPVSSGLRSEQQRSLPYGASASILNHLQDAEHPLSMLAKINSVEGPAGRRSTATVKPPILAANRHHAQSCRNHEQTAGRFNTNIFNHVNIRTDGSRDQMAEVDRSERNQAQV